MRNLCLVVTLLSSVVACTDGRGRHYSSNGPSIPAAYMPEPGNCRVWYPNRKPSQQPPETSCGQLQYRVPPGTYLIRG